MQHPVVTIVVPCYNASQYIAFALESLLLQTFNLWECIVVNDASSDNSLCIINEYSNKDSRIRSISIPHSGSPDIARSIGVNEAMTNLVLGLDADDFLCNDCLEKMLKRMSVTNSDVVFQRMVFFDQDTNKIKYTIPVEEFDMSLELSGEEAFVRTIGGWQIGFNGGLWRKSIYNKVPPGKEMNSDELTFRKRILFARKVAFCDVNYYMRLHRKSTTHLISVKLFDRLIVDHLLEKMVKKIYSEESGIPEKMRKERLINLINHQVLFVKIKTKLNPSEKSTVHKILERCYKNQSFRDLKRELPFHWKIAFLNSYFWFSIGSFFYYIIKPSKIFCSELWEK